MYLKVYCIRNSMLDHRPRALSLDQSRKPQEVPPAQHLRHHVNRTEVPARIVGALCHHGNRKKFQQSKPAGGQDRHPKACCSRHKPLNQPSAFPIQQLLSTSLLIYLVTGISGCALHENYFNTKQIWILICFEPQAKKQYIQFGKSLPSG